MTPGQARGVILSSAASIAVTSLLRDLKKGEIPSVRIPLGAGLMAILLGSTAGTAPGASATLAATAALSSFLYDPNSILDVIGTALQPRREN